MIAQKIRDKIPNILFFTFPLGLIFFDAVTVSIAYLATVFLFIIFIIYEMKNFKSMKCGTGLIVIPSTPQTTHVTTTLDTTTYRTASGYIHREDGPAWFSSGGSKEYYILGIKIKASKYDSYVAEWQGHIAKYTQYLNSFNTNSKSEEYKNKEPIIEKYKSDKEKHDLVLKVMTKDDPYSMLEI